MSLGVLFNLSNIIADSWFSFVEKINVDVLCTNGENFTIMEKVASENRFDLENYRFLSQSLPEGKIFQIVHFIDASF